MTNKIILRGPLLKCHMDLERTGYNKLNYRKEMLSGPLLKCHMDIGKV